MDDFVFSGINWSGICWLYDSIVSKYSASDVLYSNWHAVYNIPECLANYLPDSTLNLAEFLVPGKITSDWSAIFSVTIG